MKLVRGKRIVKETISLIVVLIISGIGAAVAHAQQGKQEGVHSALPALNKEAQKQPLIHCWIGDKRFIGTRQECVEDGGIVEEDQRIHCRIDNVILVGSRQQCAEHRGIVEEDQDSR